MKRYIRASKRLSMDNFRALRQYGWQDYDLRKLTAFADKLAADLEHIGNGYIQITKNGDYLGRFAVYNRHKFIEYNAGGIAGVIGAYGDDIDDAIAKASDILSRGGKLTEI